MDKILIILFVFLALGIAWSFPLWVVVNFTCWVFHLSFHLTLLQSFAICLLASVLKSLLFSKGGKD